MQKTCTKCKEAKPVALFCKDASKKDGYFSSCKSCKWKQNADYLSRNRDKAWVHTKAWREKNSERYTSMKREWSHSDKAKASVRAWLDRNREIVNQKNRARHAKLEGLGVRETLAHVSALMQSQKGLCVACRTPLDAGYHIDHVIPLAKGGRNTKFNLQLLCPTCNCSKGAKHPIDFMQTRGFLL